MVLLDPGSETQVGPVAHGGSTRESWPAPATRGSGRLARLGREPDGGLAPGRPCDAHGVDDTIEIVARCARASDHLVLVGLCAGAWATWATSQPARCYRDQPAALLEARRPVFARNAESILQRTDARRREALGARYGVWSALDMLGQRTWPARWLDDLVAAGTPVAMLFAGRDEGLNFLKARVSRRLASATVGWCMWPTFPGSTMRCTGRGRAERWSRRSPASSRRWPPRGTDGARGRRRAPGDAATTARPVAAVPALPLSRRASRPETVALRVRRSARSPPSSQAPGRRRQARRTRRRARPWRP